MNRSLTAVIGLGNPGAAYAGTRHNAGHEVLDAIAREFCVKISPRIKNQLSSWQNQRLFVRENLNLHELIRPSSEGSGRLLSARN